MGRVLIVLIICATIAYIIKKHEETNQEHERTKQIHEKHFWNDSQDETNNEVNEKNDNC